MPHIPAHKHPAFRLGIHIPLKESEMSEQDEVEHNEHWFTQQGDLSPANTHMVGGDHYHKTGKERQHWDLIGTFGLDYFQGNITRYIFRWKNKDGLKDLDKAQHYLQKYIEIIKEHGGDYPAGYFEETEEDKPASTALVPDEYVRQAMRTKCDQSRALARMANLSMAQTKDHLPRQLFNIQFNHALLGIGNELGELQKAWQKAMYYGQELDRENVKEELGDLMWFIAEACDALGFSLQDILESNIRKLRVRYPEKWDEYHAAEENRDRRAEMEAVAHPLEDPGYLAVVKASLEHQMNKFEAALKPKLHDGYAEVEPFPSGYEDSGWMGVAKCEVCGNPATVRSIDGSPDYKINEVHYFCHKHSRNPTTIKLLGEQPVRDHAKAVEPALKDEEGRG
jgi:NTP pyrophosphatase (non-canonical NTP hydrolase)